MYFFNIQKFNKDFFDENFFLYFEEIDLCTNVKKKGGKIFLSKNIIINRKRKFSKKDKIFELEKTEIGIGCDQLFIIIKNIEVYLAIFFILSKLISSVLRIIFYQVTFQIKKRYLFL